VALAKTIDTGGELFAFLLPQIDVPQGQTAHFTTVAIFEHFIGSNSIPHRPAAWETFALEGAAQTVLVPF
jgi:hypothetical protein